MAKLTNKIALVTGGGSCIGAASAQALLQEGAKVAIAGRDLKKLDEVAKALGNPANLITVQADVSDQKQVVTLVATVTKKLGGSIDILVNNAGTNLKRAPFAENARRRAGIGSSAPTSMARSTASTPSPRP